MNHANEAPDESVGTQDEPIMDVDEVSERDKLDGIIAQTISDLGARHPRVDIEVVVMQRSRESGLHFSPTDISTAVETASRAAAAAGDAADGGR